MPPIAIEQRVEGILVAKTEVAVLIAARLPTASHAGQGPVRRGVRPIQRDEALCQGAQHRRLREVHEVVIHPNAVFGVDRAGDLGIDALPGAGDEVALEIAAPCRGVLGEGLSIGEDHARAIAGSILEGLRAEQVAALLHGVVVLTAVIDPGVALRVAGPAARPDETPHHVLNVGAGLRRQPRVHRGIMVDAPDQVQPEVGVEVDRVTVRNRIQAVELVDVVVGGHQICAQMKGSQRIRGQAR